MDRHTHKKSALIKIQTFTCHISNIPNLLLICIDVTLVPASRAAKSTFRPPPAGSDQLKIFILNQKDWLSVAEWIGLGLKGLICTIEKQLYHRERQKHIQHSQSLDHQAPVICTAPHIPPSCWHCLWDPRCLVWLSYCTELTHIQR